jgi:putative methanogen marker protein 4
MPRLTLGIGAEDPDDTFLQRIGESRVHSWIAVYSSREPAREAGEGIRFRISPDPAATMIADLIEGRIAGAVRGTLPASHTLSLLKSASGVNYLLRIALLETAGGKKFLLAPVGIDEGWSVGQKVELARGAQEMARRCGLPEKIGILSGGRWGDIGRHPGVDRSLADAELVARMTGGVHYQILIEEAIHDCGIIIAPDGISGNLIFRTLVFLGSGRGHGAPVVNIGRIFVDTSRATPYYANALQLAESLLK